MAKISVIYGSTLDGTADAAARIARLLGTKAQEITGVGPEAFDADVLVLGSSTWGDGELQDDWLSAIEMLDGLDLTGKKAAVFGCCDSFGHEETFANALGILADRLEARGAVLIGRTAPGGFPTGSGAFRDGMFIGLPLCTASAEAAFPQMIDDWVADLKANI